jgi:hypothetical protein
MINHLPDYLGFGVMGVAFNGIYLDSHPCARNSSSIVANGAFQLLTFMSVA